MTLIVLMLLVAGAVGLLVMALFDGEAAGGLARRARRLGPGGQKRAPEGPERALRPASGGRLEELAQRLLPRPAVLRARLEATGRDISLARYGAACLAVALMAGALALLLGAPFALVALEAAATGLWLPHLAVGFLMARRRGRFLKVFPDAIGLMVRGLRAGLPIGESVGAIAREMPDPVGEEFRRAADEVRLGEPLEEALGRAARRIDLPEFNFLVISLAVQKETGGNLAETLENLEHIIRRRQQMRLKIKAMASEATASALIIGSLPFIMAGLMYVTSAEYMSLLFTTPLGQVMLGAGLGSLTIGALVMRKMVSFQI